MSIRFEPVSIELAKRLTHAALGIEREIVRLVMFSINNNDSLRISAMPITNAQRCADDLHNMLDILQHEIKNLRNSLPRRSPR